MLAATVSRSQPLPASLVADTVTFDQETGLLVATGDVEVLYEGRVLRANRIVYDQNADQIRADGPLVLTDPAGGVLIAGSAAMTPDLTEGLISARGCSSPASSSSPRPRSGAAAGGTTPSTAPSPAPAPICAENPTPTWAIRASRVTEDQVERRIYFEDARLESSASRWRWCRGSASPSPG